jgi:hypothetical protein
MPRFFFNVHHDRSNIDPEGDELSDKRAAWRAAILVAGEILRDLDGQLSQGQWRLAVTL